MVKGIWVGGAALPGAEQRPTVTARRVGGEARWGCSYVCRGRRGVERPVLLAHSEAVA